MISAMDEIHKGRQWGQHRVRGKGAVRSSLDEKARSEGDEKRNPILSEGRAWLGEKVSQVQRSCDAG